MNTNDQGSLQNQLPVSVDFPSDPEQFRQSFYQTYQRIANSVNAKINGLYVPQEKITSEQYFNVSDPQQFDNVYRMVVNFGALPNTATTSVAHNVSFDSNFYLTKAYGAATDSAGLNYTPVPNSNINLEIDGTNVIITTTTDRSAYTQCYVVLEYAKV